MAPFVNNIPGPAVNTGGALGPADDKPRTADGFAAIFAALFAATQPIAQSAQAFPASGNAGMDLQAVPLSPAPSSDTGSFRLADASVWNADTKGWSTNVEPPISSSAAPIDATPAASMPATSLAADITVRPIRLPISANMKDVGISPAALDELVLPGPAQISSTEAGAPTPPAVANAAPWELLNPPDGPQTELPNGFTIPAVFANPSPLMAAVGNPADQSNRSMTLDRAGPSSAVWTQNPIVIQAGGFSFPVTIGLAQVPPSPALPLSAGSLSAPTVAQSFDASSAPSESPTGMQSEMEPAAFKVATQPSSFIWSGTLKTAGGEDFAAAQGAQTPPSAQLGAVPAGWQTSSTRDGYRIVTNSDLAPPHTPSVTLPPNTSPAIPSVSPLAVQKADPARHPLAGPNTDLSPTPKEADEVLGSERVAKAPATRNSSAELPALPRDNEPPAPAVSAKLVNEQAAAAPGKAAIAQTIVAPAKPAIAQEPAPAAKPMLTQAVVSPAKPAVAKATAGDDAGATQISSTPPQVQFHKDERAAARPAIEKDAPKLFNDASALLNPAPKPSSPLSVDKSAPQPTADNSQTASDNTDRAASQTSKDSGLGQAHSADTSPQQPQSPTPSSSQPAAPANSDVTAHPANTSSASASAQAIGAASATIPHVQSQVPSTSSVPQPTADFAPVSVDAAQFAARVLAKVKDGDRQFDIRLDPPDLGRVDVQLSVTRDGQAQAHVVADKPQTLDALQRDQQTLHRALKDAGLDLGNNSLNFSLKGQDRGSDGSMPRYTPSRHASAATDIPNAPRAPSFTARRAEDGRLDIRV